MRRDQSSPLRNERLQSRRAAPSKSHRPSQALLPSLRRRLRMPQPSRVHAWRLFRYKLRARIFSSLPRSFTQGIAHAVRTKDFWIPHSCAQRNYPHRQRISRRLQRTRSQAAGGGAAATPVPIFFFFCILINIYDRFSTFSNFKFFISDWFVCESVRVAIILGMSGLCKRPPLPELR